jgi:hypothetical protein
MLGFVSLVLGLVIGFIVIRSGKSSNLGWWTLGFGAVGLLAFVLSNWIMKSSNFPLNLLSIGLAGAAVLAGIMGLRAGNRHWEMWTGFAAGLIPAILWIAFAVGTLLGSE